MRAISIIFMLLPTGENSQNLVTLLQNKQTPMLSRLNRNRPRSYFTLSKVDAYKCRGRCYDFEKKFGKNGTINWRFLLSFLRSIR
jgi:hypothetical protein